MQRSIFLLSLFLGLSTISVARLGTAQETRPDESGAAELTQPAVLDLNSSSRLALLTASEGRQRLAEDDLFVKNLSPVDRQLRLKASNPVSHQAFKEFVSAQTLDWSDAEIERFRRLLRDLRPRLDQFRDLWPKRVELIKTNGREEGGAAYCRGNAIVLPLKVLDRKDASLTELLVHELFHILSRQDADRQAKLYAIVGFDVVMPISLPDDLAGRKLTNPDAPIFNCVGKIDRNGKAAFITPVLFSKRSEYRNATNTSIFQELEFRLMVVEETENGWSSTSPVQLLEPQEVPDYFKLIGRNTSYIIHPEEVLADNFVHVVMKSRDQPDVWILDKLEELLFKAE